MNIAEYLSKIQDEIEFHIETRKIYTVDIFENYSNYLENESDTEELHIVLVVSDMIAIFTSHGRHIETIDFDSPKVDALGLMVGCKFESKHLKCPECNVYLIGVQCIRSKLYECPRCGYTTIKKDEDE